MSCMFVAKCNVMHVCSKNPNREYKLNDMSLDASDHEKDLGFIIDENLKFRTHAAAAIKKANQTLEIIKKSYTSRDAVTLSTLYKAMVGPHLQYGNAKWGPFSQGDKKSVEFVQRATKLIHGFNVKSYEDRIKQLKLPSLGYRRNRGDMIWTFKIMNGLVRVDASKLFVQASLLQTRGHPQKVFKKPRVFQSGSFKFCINNSWENLLNDQKFAVRDDNIHLNAISILLHATRETVL